MKFNLLRPLRDPLAAPAGAGEPGPDLRSRARSRYPAVAVVGTPWGKTRMPTADSECTGRAGRVGRAGPDRADQRKGYIFLETWGSKMVVAPRACMSQNRSATHTRARARTRTRTHAHARTHTRTSSSSERREVASAAPQRARARPDARFVVAIITVLKQQ